MNLNIFFCAFIVLLLLLNPPPSNAFSSFRFSRNLETQWKDYKKEPAPVQIQQFAKLPPLVRSGQPSLHILKSELLNVERNPVFPFDKLGNVDRQETPKSHWNQLHTFKKGRLLLCFRSLGYGNKCTINKNEITKPFSPWSKHITQELAKDMSTNLSRSLTR